MKKKFFVVLLALAMAASSLPAVNATTCYAAGEYTDPDEEYGDPDGDLLAGEIRRDDLQVSPSKKTIKKGKSFKITIAAVGGSEWADLPDEEWQEIVDANVDSITFRSTKTAVASVSKAGKVTAHRKGTATIKTTINLACGDTITLKTKVYVTN